MPIKWFKAAAILLLEEHLNPSLMMKSHVFRVFIALFSKVGRFTSEPILVSLIRAKCVKNLLYVTDACSLLSRQKHSLYFTITRLFVIIFRTGSPLTDN